MSDPLTDTGSPRPLGRNDSAGSGSSMFRTPRRKRPLAQHDTPMAHTVNGTHRSFDSRKAEKMYRRYAEESKRWIVGPMPVEDFLQEFLPQVDEKMPDPKTAFKNVPSDPTNERELYGPLLKDINIANRCPDIRFFDTSSTSVDHGTGSHKPDCCGYHENELKNISEKNGKRPADLGYAELFFEIKMANDPFVDPPHYLRDEDRIGEQPFINIDTNTKSCRYAKQALGQNVAYAVEACARQHRAFYFSVFIIKTRARLIRWDRAGAIVSRSFDYKRNPRYLCEFLWRFGLATPEQQGYDPTVIPGSQDDEIIFYKEISSRVAFELNLDPGNDADRLATEVERHYQPGRVTKLAIPEKGTIQYYIVSRPVRSPLSMAGRSTRGYWAVKIDPNGKEHVVAFVKDTWRVDVSRIEIEGEIYDDLLKAGVVNISRVLHHSEVPSQLGTVIHNSLMDGDEGKGADDQSIPEPDEPSNVNETEAEEALSVPLQTSPIDKDQGRDAPETLEPPNVNENMASDNQGKSIHVQCTRTDEFAGASWSCRGERNMKVTKHVHYRLILSEVGYPLSELSGTRELFEATRDTLKAIIDANNKCKRLHRDVSVDNIILVRDRKTGRRRGILIDWELSTKTDREGKARDYYRSGTWAFMSYAACKGAEGFRHSINDDMESLLYVLLYCCARYLPHAYVEDLGHDMGNLFDIYDDEGRTVKGGAGKADEMLSNSLRAKLELHYLVYRFLRSAYRFLASYYFHVAENEWKPEPVLNLWEKTCKDSLSDDDRYVHEVGDVLGERSSYHAPRTSTITGELITGELSGSYGSGSYGSGSYGSGSRSRKRSPGDEGGASRQTSKRRRGNTGKAKRTADPGTNGQRRSGSKHQNGRQRTVSMPASGRDERRSARLAAKASSRSLR